jgi:hypothetical protein
VGQVLSANGPRTDAADVTSYAYYSSNEVQHVRSMKGEVLEVYEVDEWGSAWVMKWSETSGDSRFSHSLALTPDEMELVS